MDPFPLLAYPVHVEPFLPYVDSNGEEVHCITQRGHAFVSQALADELVKLLKLMANQSAE